jgi:hypothetical protein
VHGPHLVALIQVATYSWADNMGAYPVLLQVAATLPVIGDLKDLSSRLNAGATRLGYSCKPSCCCCSMIRRPLRVSSDTYRLLNPCGLSHATLNTAT